MYNCNFPMFKKRRNNTTKNTEKLKPRSCINVIRKPTLRCVQKKDPLITYYNGATTVHNKNKVCKDI